MINWDLFTKLPCQCMSCVKRLCPFLERSLVHNKWNKNVARCLKLKYINVCQLKCEHNRTYLMMLPLVTIFVSQQRIDVVASLLANGLPVFIWNGGLPSDGWQQEIASKIQKKSRARLFVVVKCTLPPFSPGEVVSQKPHVYIRLCASFPGTLSADYWFHWCNFTVMCHERLVVLR